ncbi:Bax inhibitor 1 [Micractinium conductrix]|uniref:Bax inhibitor 1 n=1 Tax=Micractinium conductrix TaxID=554055 RepID=A0A2P6VEG7_9CHLO|nr:Bax inhibitor 1 [Micractinium conductrix]|eukprot:PSC72482.1 Bax inhibitor 1 [Micractinium conductrix]
MAVALCLSAVGVYASVLTGFGQGLGMIAFMVCTPWLLSTPASPATLAKRRKLFGGAALSQGLLLAPLVRTALALHPGVLFTAFAGTAGVFACFSAAALLSPRRQYLYLGGILSSVLSTFLMLRLGSFFFGGAALLFQAELYVGLAVFAGYVVYDTQVIVERSEAGACDELRDALSLYTDFVAIFVRLLVILLRSAEEKQRREREREARSGAGRRRDARTTRLH